VNHEKFDEGNTRHLPLLGIDMLSVDRRQMPLWASAPPQKKTANRYFGALGGCSQFIYMAPPANIPAKH